MEIQKCLKICKEGKTKSILPQAKPSPQKPVDSKKTSVKPIELSDEIKKILENASPEKTENTNQQPQSPLEDNKVQDLNQNINIEEMDKRTKTKINNDTNGKKIIESFNSNLKTDNSAPFKKVLKNNEDDEKRKIIMKENKKTENFSPQVIFNPVIKNSNINDKTINISLDKNMSRKLSIFSLKL